MLSHDEHDVDCGDWTHWMLVVYRTFRLVKNSRGYLR